MIEQVDMVPCLASTAIGLGNLAKKSPRMQLPHVAVVLNALCGTPRVTGSLNFGDSNDWTEIENLIDAERSFGK